MSRILIKISSDKQLRIVSALANEIWTEHYVPVIGESQIRYMLENMQSALAIRDQIQNGMRYVLMGSLDDPAGYFAYTLKGKSAFLSKIYVKKACRGQGWASYAVNWMLKTENLTCIELNVNRHNHIAISAYQAMGFETVGEKVTSIGEGYVMDDLVMRLRQDPESAPRR
jgi:ribosomal protein S18 acetylase RimI-like enzyme